MSFVHTLWNKDVRFYSGASLAFFVVQLRSGQMRLGVDNNLKKTFDALPDEIRSVYGQWMLRVRTKGNSYLFLRKDCGCVASHIMKDAGLFLRDHGVSFSALQMRAVFELYLLSVENRMTTDPGYNAFLRSSVNPNPFVYIKMFFSRYKKPVDAFPWRNPVRLLPWETEGMKTSDVNIGLLPKVSFALCMAMGLLAIWGAINDFQTFLTALRSNGVAGWRLVASFVVGGAVFGSIYIGLLVSPFVMALNSLNSKGFKSLGWIIAAYIFGCAVPGFILMAWTFIMSMAFS